jgi:hypothetical protein
MSSTNFGCGPWTRDGISDGAASLNLSSNAGCPVFGIPAEPIWANL